MNRRDFLKNAITTGATAAGCGVVVGPLVRSAEGKDQPLRPPGALAEEQFLSRCIRCLRCVDACPNGAITKRSEDGIVIVDRDECTGCGECFYACPYQVPQFGADGLMQKCDFCLEQGKEPACTAPCPADALSFGTMDELSRMAAAKGAEKLAGDTAPSMFIANRRGATIPTDNLVIG